MLSPLSWLKISKASTIALPAFTSSLHVKAGNPYNGAPLIKFLETKTMNRILAPICIALIPLSMLGCSERKQLESAHIKAEGQQASEAHSSEADVESKVADSSEAAEEASSGEASSEAESLVFKDKFPKVLAVAIKPLKDDRFRFDVKLSSPYDTPQRYADAWRVLDERDFEFGIRILGHDHASEQPFTRSHTIEIPSDIEFVFVEGRDSANGWSGQRFKVEVPRN